MKLLIFLFLLVASLNAITVDKQWFDNNSSSLEKLYKEQTKKTVTLLQERSKAAEDKERLEYQLLLLKKLEQSISAEKTTVASSIPEITSLQSYLQALEAYLTINRTLTEKYQENDNYEKSIKTLENQLNQFQKADDIAAVNAQLLYAYYTMQHQKNAQESKQTKRYLDDHRSIYVDALKHVVFKPAADIDHKIETTEKLLSQLEKDEGRLSLASDKAEIISDETKIKAVQTEIDTVHQKKLQTIDSLIWLKIETLTPLLQSKDKNYFTELKALQLLMEQSQQQYDALSELFKYISREYLGITQTTLVDTKESFSDMLSYSWKQVNEPFIPLGEGISILAIIKFLFIFIAGFTIASFYRRQITKSVKYLHNTSPSTRTMLSNLGYYFLVVITFVVALNSVGIDLSSLTMLVGALSVGIGFGLQNIVSNFISGIILIFEKSIRIGDIIEITPEQRGRVTQINMRSSVISTFDNIDIIIPNSTLIQNDVINLTLTDDVRRLHIPFGVAYGNNVDTVREIILNALDTSELIYIRNNPDKAPKVWMTGMGASSVDLKLLVWINANSTQGGIDSSNLSDFLSFIYATLLKNGIEIPFPQLDLHIKDDKKADE